MNDLISPCPSAFIKKRSIHDNFLYVCNLTRKFHKSRTPTLLIKLDISKAFDSVRWDYLLSILERRGFPPRWRDWVASLLATSTSWVLLNGLPLDAIQHGRGLRQGDPCRCLNHSTSMGGTRSKVEGGDRHDLEPEGMREDTRHKIYTGSGSRSSYPTSCLG
jgi:hypothetical protein